MATAGWVGAACLYVITSIHEQKSGALDAATKDTLALLRFPEYYACGFLLVGVSLIATILAQGCPSLPQRRRMIAVALLVAAISVLAADYFLVYRPLRELISPPGGAHAPEFATYHQLSESVNAVQLAMCLAASILLCISSAHPSDVDPTSTG